MKTAPDHIRYLSWFGLDRFALKRLLPDFVIYDLFWFFQTIESSARKFLGKDKSTTLVASVVRTNALLIFLPCKIK
jgi:hypothetical protein